MIKFSWWDRILIIIGLLSFFWLLDRECDKIIQMKVIYNQTNPTEYTIWEKNKEAIMERMLIDIAHYIPTDIPGFHTGRLKKELKNSVKRLKQQDSLKQINLQKK